MPESGVTKHNYLFCQFVNPARGHEGDRCDCFDTPSQRRTTLAKQRLARLRAAREINRASTSNDPESAVASDPAVTVKLFELRLLSLFFGDIEWTHFGFAGIGGSRGSHALSAPLRRWRRDCGDRGLSLSEAIKWHLIFI